MCCSDDLWLVLSWATSSHFTTGRKLWGDKILQAPLSQIASKSLRQFWSTHCHSKAIFDALWSELASFLYWLVVIDVKWLMWFDRSWNLFQDHNSLIRSHQSQSRWNVTGRHHHQLGSQCQKCLSGEVWIRFRWVLTKLWWGWSC